MTNKKDEMELPSLYQYRRPHFIRMSGSVIPKAFPSALVVAVVATVVCVVHLQTNVKLSIPSTFIPVLGFVVSLLLTYRTNTAYDRYWEGRRLWATTVVAIRNLTRNIWVNVEEKSINDLLEKKTAINLLLGFAVATKHYLREEDGSNFDDLKPLISNIKTKLPGFEPIDEQDSVDKPYNPNLPLEITLYLMSYVDNKRQTSKADVPTTNSMYAALNTLVDCLTQFERILKSPIPLAYSIHLSQTVWIYCLTLPFQIVDSLKYVTIPIVFLASFILIGILYIGGEIENPFGYDPNDLDLDEFCCQIKRELDTITSRRRPTIKDWVFNPDNRPFGQEEITASEARKLSIEEVRTLLSKEAEKSSNTDSRTREVDAEADESKNSDVSIKVN